MDGVSCQQGFSGLRRLLVFVCPRYSGKEALQQKINSRLERLECTNFGDALDQDLGNDDAGEDRY